MAAKVELIEKMQKNKMTPSTTPENKLLHVYGMFQRRFDVLVCFCHRTWDLFGRRLSSSFVHCEGFMGWNYSLLLFYIAG